MPTSAYAAAMTSFMGYFIKAPSCRKPHQRRVRMDYNWDDGWRIRFQEDGAIDPLPLRLCFLDRGKVLEMQIRWGAEKTSAVVHRVEKDLRTDNPGWIILLLSEEQYQILCRKKNH